MELDLLSDEGFGLSMCRPVIMGTGATKVEITAGNIVFACHSYSWVDAVAQTGANPSTSPFHVSGHH